MTLFEARRPHPQGVEWREGYKMPPRIKTFFKRSFLTALLVASVCGCADGTHDFQIRFHDVRGLHKGNPVYLDESIIGSVEKVDYTEDGVFLVRVAIQEEFASTATDASRFFIDTNPQKRDQMAIRVVPLGRGGNPIAEDAVVDGSTKYAVLYEQFAYLLGQNITVLESGINEFLKALQGVPSDGQIREIERQLDEIIAGLGRMSREMKHQLEREILPLLREKIEELRKSLEGSGREEDLEPLDRKMEAIDKELRI